MPKRSYITSLKESMQAFFNFSKREKKRILLLLPLLVVMALLLAWQDKPRLEQSFTMYSNGAYGHTELAEAGNYYEGRGVNGREGGTYGRSGRYGDSELAGRKGGAQAHSQLAGAGNHYSGLGVDGAGRKADSLFRFDPNVISKEGLVALGFSERQAQAIINYRNAGAVFRQPEDFARSYVVSEEKFRQLQPYIHITAQGRYGGAEGHTQLAEAGNPYSGQGVNGAYRHTESAGREGDSQLAGAGNHYSGNDVDGVGGASAANLLELNGADSLELVEIRGIGALTAGRIIEYRQRLGGFARAEQLREIRGMYDDNYQLIIQQIFVDSGEIKKIDINFALPQEMSGHPYMPSETLNKILKYRQLKGGYGSISELVDEKILTAEEAEKLGPYLWFRAE